MRIFLAGGTSVLGEAILYRLKLEQHLAVDEREAGVTLTEARSVQHFLQRFRPEFIIFAGARFGGIRANQKFPVEMMQDNLLAAAYVIQSAHQLGVKKLLYLSASCTFPKAAAQPMTPDMLLTGSMEPTCEPYAIARIAGLRLCQTYRKQYGSPFVTAIPADVFGPGDDFDPENSHVVGALIRKMHEAKVSGSENVSIWGSGKPVRDFIFSEDAADASLFLLENYKEEETVNISAGCPKTIRDLAFEIKEVVGYQGECTFDLSRPDGTPAKVLDAAPLKAMGWSPKTSLREGLRKTYQYYLNQQTKTEYQNV